MTLPCNAWKEKRRFSAVRFAGQDRRRILNYDDPIHPIEEAASVPRDMYVANAPTRPPEIYGLRIVLDYSAERLPRKTTGGSRLRGCPRCDGEMIASKALDDIPVGVPDFAGGDVCTVSASGRARLIDCQKCSKCGHSMVPND